MAHYLTEKSQNIKYINNAIDKYYLLTASNYSSLTNSNPFSVDRLRLYPIIKEEPTNSSSFLIQVNSNTVTSALFRWGIWNDNFGFPDKLLFDSGNIDVSTTGYKEILENFSFQPNRYWIGANTNISSARFTCYQEKPTNLIGLDLSQISSQNVQLYLLSPFANGLPDNIGNQSFNVTPRDNLAVWYKEA